ncbi:MAG: hypothetical protein LLF86_07555, partial [Nitrospiraceae bacterium]|nr:hypothetical protein [Nitrospiraceae bacterium]
AVMLTLVAPVALFAADQQVSGHWRDTNRDGVKDTFVQPYHRTEANDTKFDNYSTKGNANPFTGERGTADPWKQQNNDFNKKRW